jgi:hypothetical protein
MPFRPRCAKPFGRKIEWLLDRCIMTNSATVPYVRDSTSTDVAGAFRIAVSDSLISFPNWKFQWAAPIQLYSDEHGFPKRTVSPWQSLSQLSETPLKFA